MNPAMLGLNSIKLAHQLVRENVGKFTKAAFSPKYLLYTNVGISFSLSGLGDVFEQRYEILKGRMDKWDGQRSRKMALTGISVGVVCHYYYLILDRFMPGRSAVTLLKKVFVDQVVCSPFCIMTFLATMAYLEQSSLEEFIEEVKSTGVTLYKADWIVWPPAQLVNFYFLPTQYRVLYDSIISLGYDVYTSYVSHCKIKKDKDG